MYLNNGISGSFKGRRIHNALMYPIADDKRERLGDVVRVILLNVTQLYVLF